MAEAVPADGAVTVALLIWILAKLYSLERRISRLEAKIGGGGHGKG